MSVYLIALRAGGAEGTSAMAALGGAATLVLTASNYLLYTVTPTDTDIDTIRQQCGASWINVMTIYI